MNNEVLSGSSKSRDICDRISSEACQLNARIACEQIAVDGFDFVSATDEEGKKFWERFDVSLSQRLKL